MQPEAPVEISTLSKPGARAMMRFKAGNRRSYSAFVFQKRAWMDRRFGEWARASSAGRVWSESSLGRDQSRIWRWAVGWCVSSVWMMERGSGSPPRYVRVLRWGIAVRRARRGVRFGEASGEIACSGTLCWMRDVMVMWRIQSTTSCLESWSRVTSLFWVF